MLSELLTIALDTAVLSKLLTTALDTAVLPTAVLRGLQLLLLSVCLVLRRAVLGKFY